MVTCSLCNVHVTETTDAVRFTAGRNIAMKVPAAAYDATAVF